MGSTWVVLGREFGRSWKGYGKDSFICDYGVWLENGRMEGFTMVTTNEYSIEMEFRNLSFVILTFGGFYWKLFLLAQNLTFRKILVSHLLCWEWLDNIYFYLFKC